MHRLTGILLSAGGVVLVAGLLCLAAGESAFAGYRQLLGGWPAWVVIAGVVFSLWFHFCNGIRHLGWDIGWGFDLGKVYATGWLTVIASLGLTGVTLWCLWSRVYGGAA